MAKTFQLEIITPTRIFSEGQVSYVRAESPDGQFGIMSHHTATTIALGIGELKVVKNGKEYYYATTGGFADIQSESVLLLLETAELVTDIDKERAEVAIKRALEKLKDNEADQTRGKAAMARARNRLKIISQS